jgi:tetratricopeptide (TPR) repeat protein
MLQLRKLFRSSSASDLGPRSAGSSAGNGSPGGTAVTLDKTRAAIVEGSKHFAAGRYAQALAVVDNALEATPADATLLFARGSTLFAWGRFLEARLGFERAAAAGMVDFDLDMQLGWTCVNLQRLTEAEGYFRRGAAANPDSEEACIALANVLEMQGTLPAEAADFERRLSRWPKNYNGLMLLAACRFHQHNQAGGTAAYRAAISLDPTLSRAWANLGVVLSHEEQFDEALYALQRAYEIDTANGDGETVLNLATVLREVGRIDEALGLLGRHLLQNPDPKQHWLRSVFLLEKGRFTEGWVQHEFRWMREPLASARWAIRRPVWAGQDLRDKTILLHPEQGLGDAIQFIRYARLLKNRGARVVFSGLKDLGELARDFDDVDHVPMGTSLESFDYHIPLLSLPRVFDTTFTSIPAHVPYVSPRPA